MPVSKKRKKAGKPVQRAAPAPGEESHADHPDKPASHTQEKSGKPRNPFIAHQPVVRSSQRGR